MIFNAKTAIGGGYPKAGETPDRTDVILAVSVRGMR